MASTVENLTDISENNNAWMDDTLNNRGRTLYNQLAQQYTARTNDELNEIAAARYTPTYNAEVQNANNTYAQHELNYNNTVNQANKAYDKQLLQNQSNYTQSRDSLAASMLKRGMGRSSYANALLGNNYLQENAAAQGIEQNRQDTLSQALATLNQAGTEKQNTLNRLDSDLAANIMTYLQELADQDYERQTAADQYNASLVQWLLDGSKNYSRYAKKSSSSSSSKKKTTTTTPTSTSTKKTTTPVTYDLDIVNSYKHGNIVG